VQAPRLDPRTIFEDAASAKGLGGRPALADALAALERGKRARSLLRSSTGLLGRFATRPTCSIVQPVGDGHSLLWTSAWIPPLPRGSHGKRDGRLRPTRAPLDRTADRDALAVKRAQGVRLGRPRELPDQVVTRIVGARDRGEGWSAIARQLDADQVPTAQGGRRWYPATVRAVYLAAEHAA